MPVNPQIEALRTEVTLAVERAESRAAEQRASWAVREASLTDQCVGLRNELDQTQVGCSRAWTYTLIQ